MNIYNTTPRELYDYHTKNDHEATIPNIEIFYENHREHILEFGKTRPLNFYWAYAFEWHKIFTPIEEYAWQIIRSLGYVVLYPQYPVLGYRADFANPTFKIILECDGKEYHDKNRDTIRDTRLLNSGWKVFRVTGSELYRDAQIEHDEYDDEPVYSSLQNHYLNTAEGVLKSIRSIYFTKRLYDDHPHVKELMYQTLENHRLVEFDIPMVDFSCNQ